MDDRLRNYERMLKQSGLAVRVVTDDDYRLLLGFLTEERRRLRAVIKWAADRGWGREQLRESTERRLEVVKDLLGRLDTP